MTDSNLELLQMTERDFRTEKRNKYLRTYLSHFESQIHDRQTSAYDPKISSHSRFLQLSFVREGLLKFTSIVRTSVAPYTIIVSPVLEWHWFVTFEPVGN